MLIEKIYNKVYVEMEHKTQEDDFSMSNKLNILVEETRLEELDKEKLGLLFLYVLLCIDGIENIFRSYFFHIPRKLIFDCLVCI